MTYPTLIIRVVRKSPVPQIDMLALEQMKRVLARMKAMQIQWGGHECAVGKGRRTKAEKRALLAYYKTLGFPLGLTVMISVIG